MAKKSSAPKGNAPANSDGLSNEHKKALTAAGVDWATFLKRVQNALPMLIALAQIFLSESPPVMQSAKKGCTQKEQLECVLHQQICATHALCAAICNCPDTPTDDSEE